MTSASAGQGLVRAGHSVPGHNVEAHPPLNASLRTPLLAGTATLCLGLGGLFAFAAAVPVAAAVVAPGVLQVETDRQKLQHLEGGIVREIHVREGQSVKSGEVLFRMAPLKAEVDAAVLANTIATAEALEARLLAERDGGWELKVSFGPGRSSVAARAWADQARELNERLATLRGDIRIMENQVQQSDDTIAGQQRDKEAAGAQRTLILSELDDLQPLLAKGLVARPRLLALEREKARLEGEMGRSDAEIARQGNIVSETRQRIMQAKQAFVERAAEDLRAVRDRLDELREKRRAVSDVLARLDVRAPRSGVVQNLRVSTLGEVVQPGALLLEVAPDMDKLVVGARVRPQDADGLAPGMAASLRFPAFSSRTTPVAQARLASVSRDRLTDPNTGEAYFLARAEIAPDGLAPELQSRLVAGMPAELIVPTRERTLLSYLLRPIVDAFALSFRER